MRKILFSILILLLLFGCKKPIKEDPINYITFKLKPEQQVSYFIDYNDTKIKDGNLESTWNEIKIIAKQGDYSLYYWNDNYYINSINQQVYSDSNTTITLELPLKDKKGKLNVSLSSEIKTNEKQTINLLINATGLVKDISYCFYWTIGIVKAEPKFDQSYCTVGLWQNKTANFNLTDDLYYCDNLVVECTSVAGFLCRQPKMKSPDRITADRCYFLGKTLNDETLSIELAIQTMEYYDALDYLEVTVLDMDLEKDQKYNQMLYSFSENLGIEDNVVRLR